MTTKMRQSMDLDRALRDTLEPDVVRAPMPAELLEVPEGWVRPPRRDRPLARSFAVVATAAVAAALVGLVVLARQDRSAPLGDRVADPAAAIAFFGLDRRFVLETEDGIIALRLGDGDPAPVAVAQITGTPDGYAWRTLATAEIPTGAVPRTTVELRTLSCTPGAGLQRPDLVFGFVRVPGGHTIINIRPLAGTDQVRGVWDAGHFGTWHAGFFLYAPRWGDQPRADGLELVVFDRYEVSRPEAPANPVVRDRHMVSVPSAAFARDDACTGEPIGE